MNIGFTIHFISGFSITCYHFIMLVRQKRFKTYDGKEVVDVKVSTSLKSIVLEFTTIKAPLFKFTVSDLSAKVDVFKSKVDVCGRCVSFI